jgi:hypothetical protein
VAIGAAMNKWERRQIAARHEALHTVSGKRFGHDVDWVRREDDNSGLTMSGFKVERTDTPYLIQRGVEHGVTLLLPFLDGAYVNPNQCADDLRMLSKFIDESGIPLSKIADAARALLADPEFQHDVTKVTLELMQYNLATAARIDEVLA